MIFKILLICFLIYFSKKCHAYLTNHNDQLIGVTVLYRHGDRGPISSYPNDPFYNISYWPNGYGQLLDKGKLRLFKLGTWLRSRYRFFISEKYTPQEIIIKSSDVDRTLMSAASNLAGLYYPTNRSDVWQKNLAWDPIPIHTVPEDDDEILAMNRKCPKFDKLYNETLYSKYFQDVLEQNKDMKEYIEQHTGWNITTIKYFQQLYSVFYVYLMHNSSYLPKWVQNIDANRLSYLAGLSFSTETFTVDLRRLKFGPFFNYLQNNFDGMAAETAPRFLMLSAHDGTIAGILNSYGVYNYHPPEFGEMIIWELYKSSNNSIYVKLYKKSNTEYLEPIYVKNCSQRCNYNQYKVLLQSIIVDSDQWKKECQET